MTDIVRQALDRANPNTLADHLRSLEIGSCLATEVKQVVRMFNMGAAGADVSNLATLDVMKLPDNAKAISILRAYARKTAAAGTCGELAPQAWATTPADAQIAVSPCGDIVTLAVSDYSSIDVEYLAVRGEMVELAELAVSGDQAVLPSWITDRGVIMLLEAESLAGAVTGDFIVVKESDAKPGTTKWASLMLDREIVQFKATDAVTKCRLKLLLVSETGEMKAKLEADATTL